MVDSFRNRIDACQLRVEDLLDVVKFNSVKPVGLFNHNADSFVQYE